MEWNQVVVGDCLDLLRKVKPGSVDLVFADPPFNIGYEYDEYRDTLSKQEYLKWTERWLAAVKRVLKPSGSVFIAIGDEYVAETKIRLDALGLTMRNWIVWHYTFGVNCQRKFNRSHAHILYYVVDPNRFQFDPDSIRVPSARQTTYSDRRANPRGKLPDDTWVLRPQEEERCFGAETDSWFFSRVCGTFKERVKAKDSDQTAHPCQMPEAVLERIIRVSTQVGDQVLDPFAGSGTTLAVAKRLGREYLGFELSEQYAMYIKERLADVEPEEELLVAESQISGQG
jgi:site-specific DNA-methyltransferase (adenine-specific)